MSTFFLLNKAKATQAAPPPINGVQPWGSSNLNNTPQQQTFQLSVSGVGAVSATAQVYVSNDVGPDPNLYNWSKYGDPITAAGTNLGQAIFGGNQCWANFGAVLTALSGTNAAATLEMNT